MLHASPVGVFGRTTNDSYKNNIGHIIHAKIADINYVKGTRIILCEVCTILGLAL